MSGSQHNDRMAAYHQPGAGKQQQQQQQANPTDQQQPEALGRLNDLATVATNAGPFHPLHAPAPITPAPSAFLSSADATPGAAPNPTAHQQQREQQRAKRRVPNSQRKRAQVSCDACKVRRCKCVRVRPVSDDEAARLEDLPPCKLCTESGIPCVTTVPRKHRVYGSVENLDRRYRALEALVSALFPNLDPASSADELVAFGRGMGLTIPDLAETAGQASSAPSAVQGGLALPTPPSDRPQTPTLFQASAAHEKTMLPQAYTRQGGSSMGAAPPSHGRKGELLAHEDGSTGLILDASGRPHYIGPCGSLTFFVAVRELIARRLETSEHQQSPENRGDIVDIGGSRGLIGHTLRPSQSGAGEDRPAKSSSMRVRHLASAIDHLEGDSPPWAFEEIPESSPDYPNNPDYWRYRRLASAIDLPSREQADKCVDAYFRTVHPDFIIFHRGTFQHAYETLWRSRESSRGGAKGERLGDVSVSIGWLCCLYMIFIFGSRCTSQNGSSLGFQRKWFAEVDRLPPFLSTSSLPNVCAYMLLSLYYHNANDRTSSWTFQGAGCRLAIALGLHREKVSNSYDPLNRYLRKRIWWTMYSWEQFLCCSLGRPSAIDDHEMDVGLPEDHFLEGNLLPADYLKHSYQLEMLHAAIRRQIYDPSSVASKTYGRALEFLVPLAAWEEILPKRLKAVSAADGLDGNHSPWRNVHLLRIRHQDTFSFLTRPFLLRAVQSANGADRLGSEASTITTLSRVCVTSAMRCSESVLELAEVGFLNGITWVDVSFAYVACIIISLALLYPDSLTQDGGVGQIRPTLPSPELIQEYSREEMESRVKRLCQVMSSIEMCGTSARFANMAIGIAKAGGILSGERLTTERSSLPDPSRMVLDVDPNDENRSSGGSDTRDVQGHQGHQGNQGNQAHPPHAGHGYQYQADASGGPHFVSGINLFPSQAGSDLEQMLDNSMNLGVGDDIQWDMVLPPSQWNDAGLNMDMDWIWQGPTQYQGAAAGQ
ncbi:Uu.00g062710.m01.CDS01 [Anthostomella pinea]|uniref:Uu.00g062710.m01.CDS01 n=1 Tax=Anthostomella pinea TaxID=933095 RepID=A0AAI8VMN1_9PEZI|nr:Uu.00g062710.m01.CDS01 [Anthostomella pinea]